MDFIWPPTPLNPLLQLGTKECTQQKDFTSCENTLFYVIVFTMINLFVYDHFICYIVFSFSEAFVDSIFLLITFRSFPLL